MIRLRVKEVAQEKSISMTKLSHRTEISYRIIKRIFDDPYTSITLHTLDRLARVLGVPPQELIIDEPDT